MLVAAHQSSDLLSSLRSNLDCPADPRAAVVEAVVELGAGALSVFPFEHFFQTLDPTFQIRNSLESVEPFPQGLEPLLDCRSVRRERFAEGRLNDQRQHHRIFLGQHARILAPFGMAGQPEPGGLSTRRECLGPRGAAFALRRSRFKQPRPLSLA